MSLRTDRSSSSTRTQGPDFRAYSERTPAAKKKVDDAIDRANAPRIGLGYKLASAASSVGLAGLGGTIGVAVAVGGGCALLAVGAIAIFDR